MDTKKHLVDLVCKGYCKFYKESKDEGLSCEGFKFFEKLFLKNSIGQGFSLAEATLKGCPTDMSPDKNTPPSAFKYASILMDILCKKCDFLIGGCDYRDEKHYCNASPCGGFILLNKLIDLI